MSFDMESGSSDQFATVRTISTAWTGRQGSRDFLNTANSGIHAEATEVTTSGDKEIIEIIGGGIRKTERSGASFKTERSGASFNLDLTAGHKYGDAIIGDPLDR